MRLNRRQLLRSASICAGGGAAGLSTLLRARRGEAQSQEPKKPCFLIVIPAAGGGCLIDSFLAIRQSESANGMTINAYPDAEVKDIAGSPLRAVDLQRQRAGSIPIPFSANQSAFATKHKDDIMVVTQTGTSVNHQVAQRRAITGNEAWQGRTLQEAVAKEYGAGYPIPNVNMASGGYIEHGTDRSLPAYCFNEPVANPIVWPLALDGMKGIQDAPPRAMLEKARALRDGKLEDASPFYKTFAKSDRLKVWRDQRAAAPSRLEVPDLITKLMLVPDVPQIPLGEYGLRESPDGAKVRQKFPSYLTDPLHAQAALAFLLIKYRVSVTVTISPSFSVLIDTGALPPKISNPPLAFDYSHNSHRSAQAIMWNRILSTADGLIDLLKGEEFEPGSGESLWDRSMIYVATDFGREKKRPSGADDFGTGHHVNNGFVIISPLANGNKVLGGVDKDTGLTYGFDPETGDPAPATNMAEKQIYSGILHALRVDTTGGNLPDMRAMRRRA